MKVATKMLLIKYPNYHWDFEITNIEGFKSFDNAPYIQYCDSIKLNMVNLTLKFFYDGSFYYSFEIFRI